MFKKLKKSSIVLGLGLVLLGGSMKSEVHGGQMVDK